MMGSLEGNSQLVTFFLRKFCAIALAWVVFATHCVLAHATETNFWKQRQKKFEVASPRSWLPAQYGSVRDVTSPTKTNQIVIHIQDVHMNQEAQKNIGAALKELIQRDQVDLVAVEGAFAPVDFSPFRTFPYQEAVHYAADLMRQQNEISGAAHTALTSSKKIPPIVGIDDRDAYFSNVEAVKTSFRLKEKNERTIAYLKSDLKTKKRKLFHPHLLSFDKTVESYRKGLIDLGDYIRVLARHKTALPLSLSTFQEALRLEETLDFAKVEQERSLLLTQLLKKLNRTTKKQLMDQSHAFRLGQVGHADFHRYLRELCDTHNLPLTQFKAMRDYLHYVLLSDGIKPEALFQDLQALEKTVYDGLIQTQEQRTLVHDSRQLHLMEKLIQFSLTPYEWNEYKNVEKETKALESFEVFYRMAEERDKAMAENLLKAIQENKPNVVVLITGGFHSQGIKRLLANQDITLIRWTPKITKVDLKEGSTYLSIFAQEKTPLQKLFEGDKLFLSPEFWGQPQQTAMARHTLSRTLWLRRGNLNSHYAAAILPIGKVQFDFINRFEGLDLGLPLSISIPVILFYVVHRLVNNPDPSTVPILLERIKNATNMKQVYHWADQLGELENIDFSEALQQIEKYPGYVKEGTVQQQTLDHAKTFLELFHATIDSNGVPEGQINQPSVPDAALREEYASRFPRERLDQGINNVRALLKKEGESPVIPLNAVKTIGEFQHRTGIEFDVYGVLEYMGIRPDGNIKPTKTGSFKRRQFIEKLIKSGYLFVDGQDEPGPPVTFLINSSGNAIQGLLHEVQILVEDGIEINGQVHKLPQQSQVVMVAHDTLSPTKEQMIKDKFPDYAGNVQFLTQFIKDARDLEMYTGESDEAVKHRLENINELLSALDDYVDRWNSANPNQPKMHVRASNEESALVGGASILRNVREQLAAEGIAHVDYVAMGRGGGGPVAGMALEAYHHEQETGQHTEVWGVGSDIPTVSVADGQAIQNAQSLMQAVLRAFPDYLKSSNVDEAWFYKAMADLHHLKTVQGLTTEVEPSAASGLAKLNAIMADPTQWHLLRPDTDGRKKCIAFVLSGQNFNDNVALHVKRNHTQEKMAGVDYIFQKANRDSIERLEKYIRRAPVYPQFLETSLVNAIEVDKARAARDSYGSLEAIKAAGRRPNPTITEGILTLLSLHSTYPLSDERAVFFLDELEEVAPVGWRSWRIRWRLFWLKRQPFSDVVKAGMAKAAIRLARISIQAQEGDDIRKMIRDAYDRIAATKAKKTGQKVNQDVSRLREDLLTRLPQESTLLDSGTGTGLHANWFLEKGMNVAAIDLSEGMLKQARALFPNLIGHLFQMDSTRLGFQDEVFDAIWDNAAFHHLNTDDANVTLDEYHRVLKPGGKATIIVRKGKGHEAPKDDRDKTVRRYFQYYDKDSLKSLVENKGFNVIEVDDYTEKTKRGIEWVYVIVEKPNQDLSSGITTSVQAQPMRVGLRGFPTLRRALAIPLYSLRKIGPRLQLFKKKQRALQTPA